jgi:hypothetical protein
MPAAGYEAESAVLLTVAAGMLLAQAAQLLSERFDSVDHRVRRFGLKFWFHRLTPGTTLLLLVRDVDPRGANGWFSNGVITLLTNNTTALLVGAIMLAVWAEVMPAFSLSGRVPPQWLLRLLYAVWVLFFLLANVVAGVSIADNETPLGLNGAWMLVAMLSFTATLVAFHVVWNELRVSLIEFLSRHTDAQTSSSWRLNALEEVAGGEGGGSDRRILLGERERGKIQRVLSRVDMLRILGTVLVITASILQVRERAPCPDRSLFPVR